MGIDIKNLLPKMLNDDELLFFKENSYPFVNEKNSSSYVDKERNNALMAELSSHPVHLVNKDGQRMPSAFIPFCAYQTSLLLLGEFIGGLKFPVCNKFTPTVLDGHWTTLLQSRCQLCPF